MNEQPKRLTIRERLAEWFQYHAPTDDQVKSYQRIRDEAQRFAEVIVDETPESADQTAALRKLRECVMTANAAIACKGV
jgi:hypothetical protein